MTFSFKVTERCLEDMEGNCMEDRELVEEFEWWLKKIPETSGTWTLTFRRYRSPEEIQQSIDDNFFDEEYA